MANDEPVPAQSFDELMRRQAEVTLAVSGAGHSRWTGRWTQATDGRTHANERGVMQFAPEHLQALQRLYEQPEKRLEAPELAAARAALHAMLRENSRMLSRVDDGQTAAVPETAGSARVLDQGIAAAWSAGKVDAFIDRLGLEQVAPGLKAATAPAEYEREAAAAAGLSASLGSKWGWSADKALEVLHSRSATARLGWIGDKLAKTAPLRFVVPLELQPAAKAAIETAIRDGLDKVDDAREPSPQYGAAAADAGLETVLSWHRQYENPQLLQLLNHDAAAAALKITGAGRSEYDGTIGQPPQPANKKMVILGVATWPGGMLLHNEKVIEPLREMYATAGQQHDEKTLVQYREALMTLLHEHVHFAVPEGERYSDSARVFVERKWVQLGEEGFTNAITDEQLDDFIRDAGIDKIAPGITEVSRPAGYPALTPAAKAVATGIDQLTGGQEQALKLINQEAPAGKWDRITDLVYDASRLPELVPPGEVGNAKRSIEKAMRTNFAWLDENTGKGTEEQVEAMSKLRGEQSLAAGQYQVAVLEQRYSSPDSKALFQALQAAHAGVAPPGSPRPGTAQSQTATKPRSSTGAVRETPSR